MQSEKTLEFINRVNKQEAEEVFGVLASSLIFDSSINTDSDLPGKSRFISFFSRTLEEAIQNDVVKTKNDRLKVIKFLDKLKQQKEAIEFAKGDKANLQIAAERLGKKAQSAFGSPEVKK